MKRWVYKKADRVLASNLAKECNISDFTALLLVSKEINDPFEIDEFLSDEIVLQDPFVFTDMQKGVDRIKNAIENNEKIAVFGDYDCDGITSTVLMYSVLKELGADVFYQVPTRKQGYGISVDAVKDLKGMGTQLIITVDNGITAFDAIEYATNIGIDVVVTDHHLPSEKLPNAYAVIDPKRKDCFSEFKDYAGVGVALMVCSALSDIPCEDLIFSYGDLVAIGTIADIMPILKDNRAIIKSSIDLIKNTNRIGLKALIEQAGIKKDSLNAQSISFGIAPRINAAGRVENPTLAIDLLLCDDETKAMEKAKQLCDANLKRQAIEKEILNEVIEKISNDEKIINSPVIVVGGENWHCGVIGIVAAKLCEKYNRPAIVFSFDETYAHGSARSVSDTSIYDIIANNPEYVYAFGGHSSAAGITILKENFEKATVNIQNSAKKLYPLMPFNKIEITCKLNPQNISVNNAYAQRIIEPFGEKNEQPIFALCNMTIVDILKISDGKHLKLKISRDGSFDKSLEVMKFFTTREEFIYNKGDKIDLAVTLDINTYNDFDRLSIIAKDIVPSEIECDEIFKQIRVYQNFSVFADDISAEISREDIANVYKKIRCYKKIKVNELEAVFLFSQNDFCKLRLILDILNELKFINLKYNGEYFIEYIENAEKNDLLNSETYNKFKG